MISLANFVMAADQPSKSWIEAVKGATVAIGKLENVLIKTAKGEEQKTIFAVVGTGVIMAATDQKGSALFLVTARHVFYDPEKNWDPDFVQIRFSWFDQKPVDQYLGIKIKLKENGKHLWAEHKDPSVDLAALPLIVSVKEAGRSSVEPIPIQTYAAAADLYEGASILAFGYPGAVGATYWTKAVVRTGIVAWISPESPLSNTFLIDSMIFPGNSGGPVFKVPTGIDQFGNLNMGGKISFLGIVSQGRKETNPLYAGDKIIQMPGPKGNIIPISEQWVGIGVIVPAAKVRELLTYSNERIKTAK
jgi:S1-C subfamily serine protease